MIYPPNIHAIRAQLPQAAVKRHPSDNAIRYLIRSQVLYPRGLQSQHDGQIMVDLMSFKRSSQENGFDMPVFRLIHPPIFRIIHPPVPRPA
ncbi:MAG: hypothetical protein HW377_1658 [Actinobacteria bacterium]|nr:hypothetical protein [Actinomycetota bacterium]